MQEACGQLQLLPSLRPPPSRCPCFVSVSHCYTLVLQEPMRSQDPVLKKNNNNSNSRLNCKTTMFLVPSVLRTLILTEKFLSTLQMKKMMLREVK